MGKRVRIWPRVVQTVGAMQAADIPMFARCSRCEGTFKVNLELLIRAYGPDYSLLNRRGICPHLECDGTCVFLVKTGAGAPFYPLLD